MVRAMLSHINSDPLQQTAISVSVAAHPDCRRGDRARRHCPAPPQALRNRWWLQRS